MSSCKFDFFFYPPLSPLFFPAPNLWIFQKVTFDILNFILVIPFFDFTFFSDYQTTFWKIFKIKFEPCTTQAVCSGMDL